MRNKSLSGKRDLSPFFVPKPVKVPGPIVSWRAWNLNAEMTHLTSITTKSVWETPVMTSRVLPNGQLARVVRRNHGDTHEVKDHGVYSYKTPSLLMKYMSGYPVYGRLENFGHVVEHEFGYRAQKVVVQELFLFNGTILGNEIVRTPQECRILEANYGCEVKTGGLQGWIFSQEKEWVKG